MRKCKRTAIITIFFVLLFIPKVTYAAKDYTLYKGIYKVINKKNSVWTHNAPPKTIKIKYTDDRAWIKVSSTGVYYVHARDKKTNITTVYKLKVKNKIVTEESSLRQADLKCQKVEINGGKRLKSYILFRQSSFGKYWRNHACNFCSMATILTGYTKEYKDMMDPTILGNIEDPYEPETETLIYQQIGWTERAGGFYPPTLLGIQKILESQGIHTKLIPTFEHRNVAANDICNHLYSGRPVLITVHRTNQVTNKSTRKWAGSFHTMVLLGMTEKGNVIVGDSFGGKLRGYNRIKFMSQKDLRDYVKSSSTSSPQHYWFAGEDENYGYLKILDY